VPHRFRGVHFPVVYSRRSINVQSELLPSAIRPRRMFVRALLTAAATATVVAAQTPSLADALRNTSQLSTLNTLLLAHPGVLYTLGNATNITVFAPSNSALEPLSGSPLLNNSDFVTALLTYHGYDRTIRASEISSTPLFPHSFLNNTAYSNVTGGQVVEARTRGDNVTITSGLGSTANVTTADVAVSNGIVHIIDNYLTIPVSISETASQAGLTAFDGALNATNLTRTLDGLRDVTVFAPSNAAFSAIGSALGSLNATQATQILEYHVLNGTVAYSSLLTNTTVRSLTGENITITVEDGAVFVNQARVIRADVLVAGGVVHVLDSVLNPSNSSARPSPNGDNAVVAYSGASSGVVPYTTNAPTATTTNTALIQTTDDVANGYTTAPSGALNSAATSAAAGRSSSSTGGAAMPTGAAGAVGAAALFGAAAFFADF